MTFQNVPSEQFSAALKAANVPGLRVIASASDVARIEQGAACKISFDVALGQALQAFLQDARGSGQGGRDAPVSMVADMPEAHGLPADASAAQIATLLRGYLQTDSKAELVLLTQDTLSDPNYRFAPEQGESADAFWVFRIRLPTTFDVMIWAVVDVSGKSPAYAYGVE